MGKTKRKRKRHRGRRKVRREKIKSDEEIPKSPLQKMGKPQEDYIILKRQRGEKKQQGNEGEDKMTGKPRGTKAVCRGTKAKRKMKGGI